MILPSLVIITGAGISAESGITNFRGNDGLGEGHRIQDVASPEGFEPNPALVNQFYNMRRAGWTLLATLTIHHAACQAASEPAPGVRQAETTVTLESPEPTAALLQGAAQITTPMSAESPSVRLATILKIKSTDKRQALLSTLGVEIGDTNPEQGMQMILSEFKSITDRQTFGIPMIHHWAADHPEPALKACERIPEGERRALAYSAALSGWATADPHAAAAWTLENLSGIYRRTAIARIGKVWASSEPSEAANWALTYSSEVDQVFSLSEVIDTWADTYGQNAADWCANLPAGKLRDLTLSKAIFKWADYFPQTAAEWLVSSPTPNDLWLLPRVVARWGLHSPEVASAWLEKNVSESAAQESRRDMVLEWANYNPRGAFEWAAKALKGAAREITFSEIFSKWASEYPLEALLSAVKLTDEAERHIALASVFSAWCGQDLEAFSAWLKQQKPGIEKDVGIEQLADVLISSNPAAVLSDILTMQDQARLKRTLTQHYQDWKLSAPEAAEAWLKQHPETVKLMTP
jgi:hypothetical protein